MSLSDLAAVGSLVSGIAVFLSFIFLALQLRQSNHNQRSLMQQARTGVRINRPTHGSVTAAFPFKAEMSELRLD